MNGSSRKVLIFVVVMLVVAFAGWFGRKAYKRSEEHKLLALAKQYEAQKDWHNTNLCLERVLQLNPISVPAYKMIGDLLEANGSPTALSWWQRAVEMEPGNVTNRLRCAEVAIKFQDVKAAEDALSKIDPKAQNTPQYHSMEGALAWRQGHAAEAEKQYAQAVQMDPANQMLLLNLETIRLVSTNQTAASANAARLSLEHAVTDPALRPVALHHLLTYAMAQHDLPQAISYSKEIISLPGAPFADKINHSQLLKAAKNDDYSPWLASLKTTAAQSPGEAFALGRSLTLTEGPAVALHWLNELPYAMQTNQPVPLIITDCLIDQKDWNGVLAFVGKQDWGEGDFYRLAVESLAQRSLNREDTADLDWHKAVRLSTHQVSHLERLEKVAELWGWTREQTDLLREITDDYPEQKWAVDQLMAQYYAAGKTSDLQALLTKSHSANPSDVRIENNLANILLLRKSELDHANVMAKEVYDAAPADPFVISTYAYSLLLQKKPEAAVKVLTGLKPEYLKIPAIAAYYGVIQAQSGHKDVARPYIDRAETAKLLPEENEMVRLAKAQL